MLKLGAVVGIYSAALIALAAYTGVGLEYDQTYEDAYLQSCEKDSSMRACACSLSALEKEVGFVRFADEVDRHRDDFRERSQLASIANDLVAKCEATAHASQ